MWYEIEASEQSYASCFCEENVYRLAEKMLELKQKSSTMTTVAFHVIFISNKMKQTPIWCQKAATNPEAEVVWDYHVILCSRDHQNLKNNLVFDLDTVLPYPSPLLRYIEESFKPNFPIYSSYRQKFRVIEASKYLQYFASDRKHMASSGVSFPSWGEIHGEGAEKAMNLPRYWDMVDGTDERFGEVMTLETFIAWCNNG